MKQMHESLDCIQAVQLSHSTAMDHFSGVPLMHLLQRSCLPADKETSRGGDIRRLLPSCVMSLLCRQAGSMQQMHNFQGSAAALWPRHSMAKVFIKAACLQQQRAKTEEHYWTFCYMMCPYRQAVAMKQMHLDRGYIAAL